MNIKNLKIIIFVFILSLFASTSYSQMVTGFHAGLNVASLNGSKDYDDNTYRVGINTYLFVEIPFNYIVSLETGIEYGNKGMNHQSVLADTGATNTLSVKNYLNYITLPIYLKENFTNFYTKIGPYGSYLVAAKSSWKNTEEKAGILTETKGEYADFSKSLRPYDVGISVGFGYIHFFNKNRRGRRNKRGRRKSPVMQIDVKYDLGFLNLDPTGRNDALKLKNRVLTVGISFTSVLD